MYPQKARTSSYRDCTITIASIDFQMLANAGFPPVRFSPGDVIFAEGDRGDAMYVVRNGEVTIERRGTVRPWAVVVSLARWP